MKVHLWYGPVYFKKLRSLFPTRHMRVSRFCLTPSCYGKPANKPSAPLDLNPMVADVRVSFGEEEDMVKLMKTPFHVHDVHDDVSVKSINSSYFMHINIVEHRTFYPSIVTLNLYLIFPWKNNNTCVSVLTLTIFTFVAVSATLKVFRYERPFWRLQGFSGEALIAESRGKWTTFYRPTIGHGGACILRKLLEMACVPCRNDEHNILLYTVSWPKLWLYILYIPNMHETQILGISRWRNTRWFQDDVGGKL